MSGVLAKLQQFVLSLPVSAVTLLVVLLSACSQNAPGSSPTIVRPAPAQTAPTIDTSGQTPAARSLEGKVVGVADGDTLTVLGAGDRQTRVRLQGIDAPESRQAFGHVSKQNLSDLVFGRRVVVEYEKEDRYGRALGKVLSGGRDVNLEQVRAGLAWHYKYYQDEQSPEDRRLYAEAEAEARAAGRGLWADANPIPPWDFRRGKRGRADGGGPAPDTGDPAPAPTPAARGRAGGQASGAPEPEGETVYVTRTGSKYHRPGCRYLRRSRMPVSLREARRSYDPCSVCRPQR